MQTVAPVRERDPGAHGCGTGGEEGGEEESGFFFKKKSLGGLLLHTD